VIDNYSKRVTYKTNYIRYVVAPQEDVNMLLKPGKSIFVKNSI